MTDLEMLTPAEAAPMLGTSVDALRMMRRRDQGPAYVQQGRRIRYPRAAIVQYLKAHTVYTSEQPPPRTAVTPPPSRRTAPTPTRRTTPTRHA